MDDRVSGDELTVGQVARLSGVTVRTLHHYDEIGLVRPTARTDAGYRLYTDADVERLLVVVAYRACGLALPDISTLLDADTTDRTEHLRRQLALLDARLAQTTRQRDRLRRALEARVMGINLNPQELFEVFGDADPTEHAAEAEDRWGDTDAYRESHRRTSGYTKDDWLRIRAQGEAVMAEFVACQADGLPPESARAMAAADDHRRGIDEAYYPCSYEMHANLAEMYVADPRFSAHYEQYAAGMAQYVRDAIVANAIEHLD